MAPSRDTRNRWTSVLALVAILVTTVVRASHHHGIGDADPVDAAAGAAAVAEIAPAAPRCSCGHHHHHHHPPVKPGDDHDEDGGGVPTPDDAPEDNCAVCALLDLAEAGDIGTIVVAPALTAVAPAPKSPRALPGEGPTLYRAASRAPPILS